MRIQLSLIIEMDDDQLSAYADRFGLPNPARARDFVNSVRERTFNEVKFSSAFGPQDASGRTGAEVTLKGPVILRG